MSTKNNHWGYTTRMKSNMKKRPYWRARRRWRFRECRFGAVIWLGTLACNLLLVREILYLVSRVSWELTLTHRSLDMWWLATAVFLVCIIERANLDAVENFGWFNIFNIRKGVSPAARVVVCSPVDFIVFELVSAYGTVGLSLGIPTENYSFCGAFHPLSKLIVCAVMIRGRHRGLPVAIDRAVLPPKEDFDIDQQNQGDHANQDQGYDGTAQLQQHYQHQHQRDGGDVLRSIPTRTCRMNLIMRTRRGLRAAKNMRARQTLQERNGLPFFELIPSTTALLVKIDA
ncbi:TRKH superfamily [Salix suchowensis]|nr:TRKH superfamily [Salix suchowensis]